MFTVYILYSKSKDKYYTGCTSNLEARIKNHNSEKKKFGKYSRKNGPWQLVYSESNFPDRASAVKREKEIKSWKSRIMIERLMTERPAESRQSRD